MRVPGSALDLSLQSLHSAPIYSWAGKSSSKSRTIVRRSHRCGIGIPSRSCKIGDLVQRTVDQAAKKGGIFSSGARIQERFQAEEMEHEDTETGVIKVLDMGIYLSGEEDKVAAFCEQLREQCHTVGFFYVKNHSVPQELCDSFVQLAREFFELPFESKMQMDYGNSAQFRGYMRIGVENTAGITDFREQIDLGPEEAEDFDVLDGIKNKLVHPVYRRLHGPNQWPSDHVVPDFRVKAEEFMSRMGTLSMHIMQALALSLGLRKDFFDSTFQASPHYQMKVVRYPPKSEGEDVDKLGMLGVGEHSDSGFLSLLLQDDVGGLQAQTNAGVWSDVPPKEGTFVVNLGEMLQLATGGYYLATVHRVVSQNRSTSRYSIPYFFNPRLDTDIRAFNILGNGTLPCQQVLGPSEDKIVREGRTTHNGKNILIPVFGHNVFKGYGRSHPRNVLQHHPDLLQADGQLLLT